MEPLSVEILIYPRKTEVIVAPEQNPGAKPELVHSKPLQFEGPLAELKHFAHACSRRGLRFYGRTRSTTSGSNIRVEISEGKSRTDETYVSEEAARCFIEERTQRR